MKTFKIYSYLIECVTNLHVGTGGDNFGIVDKEIQRDQVDNVPIIHASSLKGAIREFFDKSILLDPSLIKKYFGSDKNDNVLQQGKLRFFEARLLSIPVRGIGNLSDYSGTSKKLLSDYNKFVSKLDSSILSLSLPTVINENAITEFGNVTLIPSVNHIGNNIAYFSDEAMNSVLKGLPIIARNSLENGQSENLWYEEVVPRGSKFYFFVAVPEEETIEFLDKLENEMLNNVVQIGANATVGYGFCKISKL